MPTQSSALRELAKQIAALDSRVRAVGSGKQLAHSSIEDGALQAYDRAGQQTMVIGKQFDGTYAPVVVGGQVPPTPSTPIGANGTGSFTVTWDGLFVETMIVPMDFLRIDVHYADTPVFDAVNENRAGSIAAASGGQLTVGAPEGIYYAKLVCWTLGGKFSVASEVVMVESTVPAGGGGGTDGNPPASSPTPTALSGIDAVYLRWELVDNADPTTYAVHGSDTTGFSADSTNKIGDVAGTFFAAKELADGTPLDFNTPYYFRLVAYDADGAAAAGGEVNGNRIQIPSGYLSDSSVSSATIADEAVVSGKLAAESVSAFNIAASTITAAQIAAEAIGTGQLAANAVTAAKIAAGTITATEIASDAVTTDKLAAGAVTATEIASNAITTAKIAAGAVTASSLAADAITGKTVTGGLFRTATSGKRLEIDSVDDTGQITFFSAFAQETVPANIQVAADSFSSYLNMAAAATTGVSDPPSITMATANTEAMSLFNINSPGAINLNAGSSVVVDAPQMYFGDYPSSVGGPWWFGYLNATQGQPSASTLTTATQWAELESDGVSLAGGGLFTVAEAGLYRLGGQFWWAAAAGASGDRLTQVIHDPLSGSAKVVASITLDAKSSGAPALAQWNKLYRLAAGDGVYVRFQWTGSNGSGAFKNGTPTGSTQDISFFQIVRERV